MKTIKYFVFTFLLLFITCDVVMAEVCDSNYLNNLKELSLRINYDSNYVGEDSPDGNIQTYEISFSGLEDEFYVVDSKNTVMFNYDSDKNYVLSGKNTFYVYSSKCYVKIKEINVDLLKFNEYSVTYCEGYDTDGIEFCDPWYQGKISKSAIESVVNELEEKQRKMNENTTFLDKIINILQEYWYFAVLIFMFLVIIIYLSVRKYIGRSMLE